eukprot:JP446974.1.p2 GENE.JP446974.1~~JP446974.1.p2  ORF type:complete len:79 (+),score=24.99 JP446974.1:442-678(+)
MLQRTGEADALNGFYIASLGGYRFFYLLNWAYRAMTESDYSDRIVWIAGLVQTGLYADFFYYYIKSVREGKAKLKLPS